MEQITELRHPAWGWPMNNLACVPPPWGDVILDQIVVDLELSVLQIPQQSIVLVEEIVHGLTDRASSLLRVGPPVVRQNDIAGEEFKNQPGATFGEDAECNNVTWAWANR
jgi:hypothetical protein